MKYLNDIEYELDLRDLMKFHNNVWITNDRDNIPLKEMGSDHIKNSIKFINAQGKASCYGLGPVWVPKLKEELSKRGINYEE